MKSSNLFIISACLIALLTFTSCEKNNNSITSPSDNGGSVNPGRDWFFNEYAYYNNNIVQIDLAELTPKEEDSVLNSGSTLNTFYDTDAGPNASPYLKVLGSEPQAPGLWRLVGIKYFDTKKERQFVSEQDIINAAKGTHPLITLVNSNQVFEIRPH